MNPWPNDYWEEFITTSIETHSIEPEAECLNIVRPEPIFGQRHYRTQISIEVHNAAAAF